ncbi:hypothetical protein B296_00016382 [Ensete ventricosum]|uniref:Uncharacterized protein n=1 Tax=Ensete ventricosum TaxID=4639 RepID=A0A426ZNF1_ENSVE|nr:hypothetical protein B296_00016382 [Ensete ventricosum]
MRDGLHAPGADRLARRHEGHVDDPALRDKPSRVYLLSTASRQQHHQFLLFANLPGDRRERFLFLTNLSLRFLVDLPRWFLADVLDGSSPCSLRR